MRLFQTSLTTWLVDFRVRDVFPQHFIAFRVSNLRRVRATTLAIITPEI
jgi:hypothetical protein